MTIISNNYQNILKDLIFKQINSSLSEKFKEISYSNDVFNYINLLSDLDSSLCNIAKESLISIFESIDKAYANSIERKHKYHIKAHHKRTILTIFGEITFTRTYYSNKDNTHSFCYLDRYLGLQKYDYFDPYIKAAILEYAANNSVPTVCKMINDLIGNKMKLANQIKYLNRQTVRNIILQAKVSTPEKKELSTPDTLYIIADEKWTHTQNNNHESVMVKSIVIFDSIKEKPRRHLYHKRIFAGFKGNDFLDKALDYLYYTYDLDKVKTIYVMGDGASWIKSLTSHFKVNENTNVIFALDRFHFKQAIHHICLNHDLEEITASYILNNQKDDFESVCNNLIESFPYRKETIEKKKEYIFNNWKYIINLDQYKLSCPMESQISHNLAYLLTSRPKGYSLKTLNKILELRLLLKNKENIKMLYLNNYNQKEIIEYQQDHLNFDIYNRYQKENNEYKINLYNPGLKSYYSFL